MKEQTIERRQADFPDIFKQLGKHDEAIETLKSTTLQTRQDFVGHKAETLAIVHEHKLETSTMVQRIEDKMEAAWDSIAIKLNTLQKFQWTILIGGAVIASMIVGEIIIAWQILINHDSLMWIWKR